MDNLTQEQIKEQIAAMQKQVAHFEEQVEAARGQVIASRGALQMLEHLLSLFNPEPGDELPESEANDGADS